MFPKEGYSMVYGRSEMTFDITPIDIYSHIGKDFGRLESNYFLRLCKWIQDRDFVGYQLVVKRGGDGY